MDSARNLAAPRSVYSPPGGAVRTTPRARRATGSRTAFRRDWVAKSLAGTLLGLTLAFGCSGLLDLALRSSVELGTRGQLAMWLVPPVWFTVLSLVFLFSNGRRAWFWLGMANVVVFGALLLCRHS